VKRVSGKSWDQFVEEEIMAKLGMDNSVGIYQNIRGNTNIASPHKTEDNQIHQIGTYTKSDGSLGAAGGIYSSAKDMSKWVLMHLNNGIYGESLKDTLISKSNHQQLWSIHTNISYSAFGDGEYNTHYRGYGLGFNLRDENGYTIVQHSGGLPGMLSMVTMIPELNAGIIVLTNTDPGGLSIITLTNEIKDEIINVTGTDWFEWAHNRLNERQTKADSVVNAVWAQVEKAKNYPLDYENYVGIYQDDWFGKVSVYQKDNQLWMKSQRSPKLNGRMHFYKANSFAVAWDYQDMNCDAFAIFQLDENGEAASISMKGISPDIDFSFDFHDLELRKIVE
jgi:CubicO group peptidase (beta-lactamase class C family)